jgi:hypothetical protein
MLLTATSWIHFDDRLLMTADGRGHEALLRHSARGGFFCPWECMGSVGSHSVRHDRFDGQVDRPE